MKTPNLVITFVAGLLVLAVAAYGAMQMFTPASAANDPKGPATLADRAREELAKELGVPVSEIKIVNVEEVDWPDGSLGCAQVDMSYIQVITPGQRITVEHDGKQYEYHTGSTLDGPVVKCKGGASTPLTDPTK